MLDESLCIYVNIKYTRLKTQRFGKSHMLIIIYIYIYITL